MPDSVQLWLTVATVGAAVAWLVHRFLAPTAAPGCDRCAAPRIELPKQAIRPKSLRVLGQRASH